MASDPLINVNWLSGTDWYGVAFMLLQVIIAAFVVAALVYFLIIKPRRYKHPIIVFDVTGGGMITYKDRGGFIVDRQDNTGSFRLVKDKNASLMMPPRKSALPTRTGKMGFHLLKIGEGSYDYKVLDYTPLRKDATQQPHILSLADESWVKVNLRRAAERKTLGNWWAENKGMMIMITAIVISMIIVMGSVKMAGTQASGITAASTVQVERLNEVAEALKEVARSLGGSVQPTPTNPPPPAPP